MQSDVDRPRAVVALFRDRVAAENAIRALQDAGFSRDAIGVATRDRTAQGRLAAETDSKAAEGAAIGAATGGILGALVGMGIPDDEARHFDRGFREGGTLATLEAASRETEAREILRRFGGDLGGGIVDQDESEVIAGAFPGAAVEERAAWAGSDRRDAAHRGRRRSDR